MISEHKRELTAGAADGDHVHQDHGSHDHEHSAGPELHTFIGISLVLGFTFMLLVDQLSGGHVHGSSSGKHIHQQFHCQTWR